MENEDSEKPFVRALQLLEGKPMCSLRVTWFRNLLKLSDIWLLQWIQFSVLIGDGFHFINIERILLLGSPLRIDQPTLTKMPWLLGYRMKPKTLGFEKCTASWKSSLGMMPGQRKNTSLPCLLIILYLSQHFDILTHGRDSSYNRIDSRRSGLIVAGNFILWPQKCPESLFWVVI